MAGMKDGIIKRGKTFSYVIQVPDPTTGKTKPKWFGGFATEKKAKDAREDARAAQRAGTYIADERLTLAEFLRAWIAGKQASPKTLTGYRYHVEHYVTPRIGHLRLQQMTPDVLTRFYSQLAVDGGRGGGELGWSSISAIARTMSSALGTAEKRGLLPRNPARLADLPPKPAPTTRAEYDEVEFQVFDPAELVRFTQHVLEVHRLGVFFALAGATGARRGELLHLRWKDVDLDGRQLHIRGSRGLVDDPSGRRSKIAVDGPTKTKKPRTISISSDTVAALRLHRQQQIADRLKAGPLWIDDDDFVFRTQRGGPIRPDTPTKLMPQLCAGAGVKRLKLHELRHTHATILLNHPVPIHEVSQRLGHADTNETLRVYARVIRARQDALGDVFAEALRTSS